jgi:hypothetical protein
MGPPIKDTKDPALLAQRQKNREKTQRHRHRQKILNQETLPKKKTPPPTKKSVGVPPPVTLPQVLRFNLPPPRPRKTPAAATSPPPRQKQSGESTDVLDAATILRQLCCEPHRQAKATQLRAPHRRMKERDNAKERVYCARSRLKKKMRLVLEELEDTLLKLKDANFRGQKRGGKTKDSAFRWCYQFDAYNHSTRDGRHSGYELGRPGTIRHNIQSLGKKNIRVHITSRAQMLKKFVGNKIQNKLQETAWDLVAKFIAGMPPLKDWAGKDYKVQFSMMTAISKHSVAPHFDSGDIAPQYSICLGDYSGGELLTWEQGKHKEPDPHLATDVRNKLLRFDGRLKHAVNAWKGDYRINVAFYKHYDSRWTKVQRIQKKPLLVMDFNRK